MKNNKIRADTDNLIVYSTIFSAAIVGMLWFLNGNGTFTRNLAVSEKLAVYEENQTAGAATTSAKIEEKTTPLQAVTGSNVTEQKKEPTAQVSKEQPVLPVAKNRPVVTASTGTTGMVDTVLLAVPFSSQAPLAQWSDPRFQYACEEASVLMAMRWADGLGALTKTEATAEILRIVAYEIKTINNYYDTSAKETLDVIIKGYYQYSAAALQENSDIAAIKSELLKGNLLILPMDGKKLKNPNFKNGGPDEHMIVIRGYDPATKEFITNDPGTRNGEGYRYPEEIIWSAWRDYPSGDHLPIIGIKKDMIVIPKQKK